MGEYTNKKREITEEELKRYIVLEERTPIMYETTSGQWELRSTATRILVPPEFLRDKEGIKEVSSKWMQTLCKEYEGRGLTPPPFMPIEFWITEPIEGVRELSIDKLSEKEIERILTFYSRGKEDDKKLKEKRKIADRGRVSVSLTSGLSLQKEPTLFDDLGEEKGLQLMGSDKENYVDRKGRPIALTKYQNKLTYALAHYLSQSIAEGDVQEYISTLESNPRKLPKKRVERSINLKEFYKDYMSPDGKARPDKVATLRNELQKYSEIQQVQIYGDGKKKIRLKSPMILKAEELEDLTPEEARDKSQSYDIMNVIFTPIFLYKLSTRYAPITAKSIRLLGKKGSGTDTELFLVLYSDLLSKFPQYRLTMISKTHDIRRVDYRTKEEYLNAVDAVKRESLTYIQNLTTLLLKVTTDYSSCKQYRAKFKRDLDKALQVLREELRLISEGELTTNSKGELALKLVFNEGYSGGVE